jgi:TonB family protein
MGGAFDAAALKAVSDSTFQSGKIGGVPAAVWIDVWIPFHADRSPSQPEILPLKHVDQPPILVSAAEAVELHSAGRAKFSGDVEVSVLVTEEGLPASLHVARPLGLGLDQRAVEEVSQYHFKAAMKDGNPVPMRIDVRVSFRLD